jgi:hypothetical protein
MVNIFCTNKLEKIIGKKLMDYEPLEHLLGNRNANIFSFQGRKCLILMNDETYYSILFLHIIKAGYPEHACR